MSRRAEFHRRLQDGVAAIERRSAWAGSAALLLVMGLAALVLYRKMLGTTFFFDDWGWILNRREWRWQIFLVPYNGHLSFVPLVIYKVLFSTVGLSAFWAFKVTHILLQLVTVAFLYVLVRRRVGDALALAGSTLVLFMGAAWHDLLVPFQLSFMTGIAAALGMLLALERRDVVGDVAAMVLLLIALGSSALGIPIAVAATVELAVGADRARRLWSALIPVGLYGVWYLVYRDDPQGVVAANGPLGDLLPNQVPITPSFMADSAAAALSGLLGLGLEWSRPLLALAVIALFWRLAAEGVVSVRLVTLLAFAVSYWGILGLFRAGKYNPSESRYVYLGGILFVLIAAELARGRRLALRGLAVVAVLVIACVVGSFKLLRDGSRMLQGWSGAVGSALGAVEIAGDVADPDLQPDAVRIPYVRAGPYLAAVADLGSPALTREQIAARPEVDRQAADVVLAVALRVDTRPAAVAEGRGHRPRAEGVAGGNARFARSCVTLIPSGQAGSLDLVLPREGIVVHAGAAPVEFRLRTFAKTFAPPAIGTLVARSRRRLTIPVRRGIRWHVRLTSADVIKACGRRGAA